jgi:hypothetical protein
MFKHYEGRLSCSSWKEAVQRLGNDGIFGRPSPRLPECLETYDTDLVGLQIDDSFQTISFLWLPTVVKLLLKEVKRRRLTRSKAER